MNFLIWVGVSSQSTIKKLLIKVIRGKTQCFHMVNIVFLLIIKHPRKSIQKVKQNGWKDFIGNVHHNTLKNKVKNLASLMESILVMLSWEVVTTAMPLQHWVVLLKHSLMKQTWMKKTKVPELKINSLHKRLTELAVMHFSLLLMDNPGKLLWTITFLLRIPMEELKYLLLPKVNGARTRYGYN